MKYMNFSKSCYFRPFWVLLGQSHGSHLHPQPSGFGLTGKVLHGFFICFYRAGGYSEKKNNIMPNKDCSKDRVKKNCSISISF